jgi:hypothetical protein
MDVLPVDDPYLAPECKYAKALLGFRDDEKEQVRTSAIVQVNGRSITTYSGSTYILEEIDPDYLIWMERHGYAYNPECPIADKRKKK